MDQNQGFCSFPMVSHSQTPTMCTAPESNLGPHCSNVANTALVPSSIVPVDRLTSPSSPPSGHNPAILQLPQPTAAAPLQLAAWRVSGNNSLHRKFRQTLSSLSCHPGGRKQTPATNQDQLGESGNSGVIKELSIPFSISSSHLEFPDQTVPRWETIQVPELLQISHFLDSSPN